LEHVFPSLKAELEAKPRNRPARIVGLPLFWGKHPQDSRSILASELVAGGLVCLCYLGAVLTENSSDFKLLSAGKFKPLRQFRLSEFL
jgi:hypothetical protein